MESIVSVNKKAYVAPAMEVLELESEVLMLEGSSYLDLYNTTVNEEDQLVTSRRGRWGDLWYGGD